MSRRRPGRSSSFNAPSTWFLCSDVSTKLPVLKDQGVCWKDEVKVGPEGGGVVGCGIRLVRAMRSNTAVHISASCARVMTSFMSELAFLRSKALEVI